MDIANQSQQRKKKTSKSQSEETVYYELYVIYPYKNHLSINYIKCNVKTMLYITSLNLI